MASELVAVRLALDDANAELVFLRRQNAELRRKVANYQKRARGEAASPLQDTLNDTSDLDELVANHLAATAAAAPQQQISKSSAPLVLTDDEVPLDPPSARVASAPPASSHADPHCVGQQQTGGGGGGGDHDPQQGRRRANSDERSDAGWLDLDAPASAAAGRSDSGTDAGGGCDDAVRLAREAMTNAASLSTHTTSDLEDDSKVGDSETAWSVREGGADGAADDPHNHQAPIIVVIDSSGLADSRGGSRRNDSGATPSGAGGGRSQTAGGSDMSARLRESILPSSSNDYDRFWGSGKSTPGARSLQACGGGARGAARSGGYGGYAMEDGTTPTASDAPSLGEQASSAGSAYYEPRRRYGDFMVSRKVQTALPRLVHASVTASYSDIVACMRCHGESSAPAAAASAKSSSRPPSTTALVGDHPLVAEFPSADARGTSRSEVADAGTAGGSTAVANQSSIKSAETARLHLVRLRALLDHAGSVALRVSGH